jgi:hypothetical protein
LEFSFNPLLIIANSITITGGDLWNYLTSGEERVKRAQQLFGWILSNQLTIADPARFKLSEGRHAHDFLEGRKKYRKNFVNTLVLVRNFRIPVTNKRSLNPYFIFSVKPI